MIKLLMAILFVACIGNAKLKDTAQQEFVNINVLVNPGFENQTTGWSATGGTLTVSTGDPAVGKVEGVMTASAGSQTFESDLYTTPDALEGSACTAQFHYRSAAGANFTARVIDGSTNILGSSVLSNTTPYIRESISFTCPTSDTIKVSFISSASGTLVVDQFYMGSELASGASVPSDVVKSPSATDPVVYSLIVTNSGTPTISKEYGDWVDSLTDDSTANTTINLTSGAFTDTPACSCAGVAGSGSRTCQIKSQSTSAISVRTENTNSGGAFDADFNIICHGVK